MKKKYNKEYIDKAKRRIDEILNDNKEFDDWTQFCFSMQDAVQAAATIWGCSTDESIDKLNAFVIEMVYKETQNIRNFDITFKKK